MSRRSKRAFAPGLAAGTTWRWRRRISRAEAELWLARLAEVGCTTWTLTERPERVRAELNVYLQSRQAAVAMKKSWRGQVRAIRTSAWAVGSAASVTKIGRGLEIVHGARRRVTKGRRVLFLPHGLAFGSGEHSTTHLLLRALLARKEEWSRTRMLDLGTGSGILALVVRLLGARKIVATDFDAEAIRVARENEVRNFPKPLVAWRHADVRRLKAVSRYDLVLANLFSGILAEAATPISRCLVPGGQLWASGILRSQSDEVSAAFRGTGLRMLRVVRRGKWVMQQWQREQE